MSGDAIYRGWGLRTALKLGVKRYFTRLGLSHEAGQVVALADRVGEELTSVGLQTDDDLRRLSEVMARDVVQSLIGEAAEPEGLPLYRAVSIALYRLIGFEGWFSLPPEPIAGAEPLRSELWEIEDGLRRSAGIMSEFDTVMSLVVELFVAMLRPVIEQCPALVTEQSSGVGDIRFETALPETPYDLPDIIETMRQLTFAPELDASDLAKNLRERLHYNLILASGLTPSDPRAIEKATRFATKAPAMPPRNLIATYLGGTPLEALFKVSVPIVIPQATRFEHQHIVAGSGHGKTQALQQLILSDLDAVAAGQASIVVIDSQRDLIENIAGLSLFAPGGPLHGRLCLIDPTDVEWPVALNLFDFGMERIDQYSQLDRERLINGVLELYDFVLGSLLDAGMTQKQSVIFRYITRLLLHIPNATIHTFRELLEDNGLDRYRSHVNQLSGSAKAFFETEFQSREFAQTRKQVLRRLYGILENQTFERMFSHPKSKLDLFAEMNAGKVILINTAKDLLKENGTEIFGRFFIAMIAQAAQERAVLPANKRLPTFVYVDEANDYFDPNIGIILSQARKYGIGMILAHQFLGQLDGKLHEAIAANTAIKFAGGVSAKDARALSSELRTDPGFIEEQNRLSFAAFVRGVTKRAASIAITPGEMEKKPRMSGDEREAQRTAMRKIYAVHYSEIGQSVEDTQETASEDKGGPPDEPKPDSGEPMPWE